MFYNAGQYQIILGTGVVNRVYDECCAMDISVLTKEEIKELKETNKNKLQKAVRTLGDVFVPIIPVIVATGLIFGLKGALFNDNFLGLFGASSADIPQNILVLLDVLSGTTFSFMPALVCRSAFKTFGGNPVLGIVLGLMLVSTSFRQRKRRQNSSYFLQICGNRKPHIPHRIFRRYIYNLGQP